MKKLIFPVIVMLSLFLSVGCSTKFNVAAPYKNVTVIYGFLDKADTAHYIRIQKAFLDQNKSALTMAQSADSNFNTTIDVVMERLDYSNSGRIVDTIHLNMVNLTTEGYPKSAGVFFTAPNYAYKFTNTLDPNYIYRIKVTNFTTGEVDSADAPIIDDASDVPFTVDVIDDTTLNREGMDFASTFASKYFEFFVSYTPSTSYPFSFQGQTTPAYIAQAIIRLNWSDSNVSTKVKTPHSYDYNLGYLTYGGSPFDYRATDLALYGALVSGMGAAPAGIVRLIDRWDIFVYLSTYDYDLYEQNSATQGTGLTGSEVEPVVTNIKGANALGLFTSKGVRSGPINLTLGTIDSLESNPITQPLKIVGTVY